MEDNEGRGDDCQRFPKGHVVKDLPLDPKELVYGIYKEKYYFTPLSVIIKNRNEIN